MSVGAHMDSPALAPLASIPALARLVGRSRSSMFRLLLRLHKRDLDEGRDCDWLVRSAPRSKLRVNVARLESAHPALFATRFITRDELATQQQALEESVRELDGRQNRLEKRIDAIAVSLQSLSKRLQSVAIGR